MESFCIHVHTGVSVLTRFFLVECTVFTYGPSFLNYIHLTTYDQIFVAFGKVCFLPSTSTLADFVQHTLCVM